MKHEFLERLSASRLLPVATIEDSAVAVKLANAVESGGLGLIEVTLRTDAALDTIQRIATDSNVIVGAGTILNEGQCAAAVEAGAAFVVSPGLDEGVVAYCFAHQVTCIPGVATATELQKAYNLDIDIVKFFPAEASGGIKALKALAGPFPWMSFVPTGGINPGNVDGYLKLPQTLAIGGSWMVAESVYAEGDFSKVTELVKQAVALTAR